MKIEKTGKYLTRSGKTAEITLIGDPYTYGCVELKTKVAPRTWSTDSGLKVCYSGYGKNGDDLIKFKEGIE